MYLKVNPWACFITFIYSYRLKKIYAITFRFSRCYCGVFGFCFVLFIFYCLCVNVSVSEICHCMSECVDVDIFMVFGGARWIHAYKIYTQFRIYLFFYFCKIPDRLEEMKMLSVSVSFAINQGICIDMEIYQWKKR